MLDNDDTFNTKSNDSILFITFQIQVCIPLVIRMRSIWGTHPRSKVEKWQDSNKIGFPTPLRILSQFLMACFKANIWRGNLPNSSNTPILVVCFFTPRRCLHIIVCKVSTGLFLGNFRQPQKSAQYTIFFYKKPVYKKLDPPRPKN